MLRFLVRKLQEHFEDVGNLRELKAEIRRQRRPKTNCNGADVARLQAHLDKLNKHIDKGAEKILTAPASLTTVLTTKLES